MILTCGLTWVGINGRYFLCERTSRYSRVASGEKDEYLSQTHGHMSQTHGHMSQTHGHMSQTHDHMSQTHDHMSQTHGHMSHTQGSHVTHTHTQWSHVTQTHGHMSQTHGHMSHTILHTIAYAWPHHRTQHSFSHSLISIQLQIIYCICSFLQHIIREIFNNIFLTLVVLRNR